MSINTLDELKTAWNELSQNLERQNVLAFHQFKENKLARFRFGLQPLVLGQTLQLILGALIAAVSAKFWTDHIGRPHLVVSGLVLQAYGIMFMAFSIRDLLLIRQIDYDAPILLIQKQLAQLRAWHIRAAVWFAFTGSFIWLPVMFVALYLLGADFWLHSTRQVYWLIFSVLACVIFNYGLMRLARTPGKCGHALHRSWIGRSVSRAQAMLDEIEQFERDLI